MPLISIVMPCYNAGKFLELSVRSVIAQIFTDWELIIVDDGSTDNSATIGKQLSLVDHRIKLVQKENGGYVSARLYGYDHISPKSEFVIFYDADDKLHPEMLGTLATEIQSDPAIGAAYCDHLTMDENGKINSAGVQMARVVPTRWWVRKIDDSEAVTPFISIFCWTKMIEPMTLIRRSAYEQTDGWDRDFGKGQGNIGDGVYLFSEIALNWQIRFINRPLYYYRRHLQQSSAVDGKNMKMQADKVIDKWRQRLKNSGPHNQKLKLAILFYYHRLATYQYINSLKHELRYHPMNGIRSLFAAAWGYFLSLPLCFSYKKLLD